MALIVQYWRYKIATELFRTNIVGSYQLVEAASYRCGTPKDFESGRWDLLFSQMEATSISSFTSSNFRGGSPEKKTAQATASVRSNIHVMALAKKLTRGITRLEIQ